MNSKTDKPVEKLPIEKHAARASTPGWLFAATCALKGWGAGQELSAEDYDRAVEDAGNVEIGYKNRFAR